ncbi:hypothetical protein PV08_06148 [Exophiala spinifera]|uniref:Uncharacterized protein n=1 Tax=Exophiala spinifera TaxID=91928 RepID=A0A0D1ZTJ4_9EURO|nr:uncharacterized protein PV08_06148 [Exophiala spinifera]KIW16097.1 hypothetical protein PV08_06148 [Exophiala spinifera]
MAVHKDKRRSVLVTGCSSGIGKALVDELRIQGLRVFAGSRSVDSLSGVVGVEPLELDPASPESIAKARDEVSRRTGGKLDILINNAGQWLESPAIETDLKAIKAMFDVNLFGVMEMNRQFSPLLIAAKGVIVNHGSMVRAMPHPMTAAYNASKAALSQYSNTLRLELEPLDVRVVELVTGRVSSSLISIPTLPESSIYKPLEPALVKRAREAETVQAPAVFAKRVVKSLLVANPAREIYKGTMASISWFLESYGPKWIYDPIMRTMTGLKQHRGELAKRASHIEA